MVEGGAYRHNVCMMHVSARDTDSIFIARQHATHAERDIVMAFMSVRLSVRLSVHCRYCVYTNGHRQTFLTVCILGVSFCFFFNPHRRYKIAGEPLSRDVKYSRVGIFFLQTSPFISKTVRDRPIVTLEN